MRVALTRTALQGLLLAAPLAGITLPAAAAEFTLLYKDGNKWVAPEDNKPLIQLLHLAKNGTTRFKVMLPKDDRELAIVRLQVLQDLLAREAKTGVILEEIDGKAEDGTLWVRTAK